MDKQLIGRMRHELLASQIERFKGCPKRTIARVLAKEHPDLFSSVEHARRYVRVLTGNAGKDSKVSDSTRALGAALYDVEPAVPDTIVEQPWRPYELPDTGGLWLVAGDLHLPFHYRLALETMVAYVKRLGKNLKGILLDGDVADQYNTSWWKKDPLVVTMDTEIRALRQFFAWIAKEFPKLPIVWKFANHETRFEDYFLQNNPGMAASHEVRRNINLLDIVAGDPYEKIFDRVTVVEDGQPIYYKKLTILHEVGRGIAVPVNPARSAFLKTKSIVLVAHSHTTSSHTEADFRGNPISTWSIGCLCNLHPKYDRYAHLKWNHGFALLDQRGTWGIDNKKIIDGKVV